MRGLVFLGVYLDIPGNRTDACRVIRAVIFDLDGTLVHSLPGLTASLNRVLVANGLTSHPEAVVRTFIGNGIFKLIERALPADSGAEKIEALVAQMSADYAASWQQGTAPYPGTADTLMLLHDLGIRLDLSED